MAINTMADGKKVLEMGLVLSNTPMEMSILVNGKTETEQEREPLNMQMVITTKVVIYMEKDMVTGHLIILMVISILAPGKMEKEMGQESLPIIMERNWKDNGPKINFYMREMPQLITKLTTILK
jgi:hypothetical protein